jgi:hypothetical protein
MLEDTKGIIGHGQDDKVKSEDCSKDKKYIKAWHHKKYKEQ